MKYKFVICEFCGCEMALNKVYYEFRCACGKTAIYDQNNNLIQGDDPE